MGITKFMTFFRQHYPHLIVNCQYSALANRTLAVDASSFMYKYIIKTIKQSSYEVNILTDSEGNQTGHLLGLMSMTLQYLKLGIRPIWVMDGVPPTQKLNELRRRKAIREEATAKAIEAEQSQDFQQAYKQKQRSIKITEHDKESAKTMLEYMGMPVFTAKSEAQAQCAWLAKKGLADGVISSDLDTMAFGSPNVIQLGKKDQPFVQIKLQELLRGMQFSYEKFVDFCILCGCDYTGKISNIGPVKAQKFLKEYGTIQELVENIERDQKLKKKHPIKNQFNYVRARELFIRPSINEQINQQTIQQRKLQPDKLEDFMLQKNFNYNRVKKWIQQAIKYQELLN